MSQPSPFFDPPLPFPIKVVPSATGPIQIYEIPDDQKEAILEQLNIFRPVPSLDDDLDLLLERQLGGLAPAFALLLENGVGGLTFHLSGPQSLSVVPQGHAS
jgi:hypothetical protein